MLLKIKIIFVQYDIFFYWILPIAQIILTWIVYFAKMPFVQVEQSHPTVMWHNTQIIFFIHKNIAWISANFPDFSKKWPITKQSHLFQTSHINFLTYSCNKCWQLL